MPNLSIKHDCRYVCIGKKLTMYRVLTSPGGLGIYPCALGRTIVHLLALGIAGHRHFVNRQRQWCAGKCLTKGLPRNESPAL